MSLSPTAGRQEESDEQQATISWEGGVGRSHAEAVTELGRQRKAIQ